MEEEMELKKLEKLLFKFWIEFEKKHDIVLQNDLNGTVMV